jgi:hypothetical protein
MIKLKKTYRAPKIKTSKIVTISLYGEGAIYSTENSERLLAAPLPS